MTVLYCLKFADGYVAMHQGGDSKLNCTVLPLGHFTVYGHEYLDRYGRVVYKAMRITYSRWANIVASRRRERCKKES